MGLIRRLLVLACLALACGSAASLADAKDDYKAGLDAVERRDWGEVARLMKQAIAERPLAEGRFSGGGLRRYTPHYFYGLGLAELGRCREAIASFDESERQSQITKTKEYENLQQRRTLCSNLAAQVDRSVASGRALVEAAASTASEVAKLANAPPLANIWNRGQPSYASRQQQGLDGLARARSSLDQASSELNAAAAVAASHDAEVADELFSALRDEAQRRLTELDAQIAAKLAALSEITRTARRDLAFVTSSLSPLPSALAGFHRRLKDSVETAEEAGRSTPVSEFDLLHEQVVKDLRALRGAFRAPPDALMEAAEAYFGADYELTLELLGGAELSAARAAAHACLFQAAAQHALYVLGGGEDAALLAAAEAEAQRCHQLEAAVEPPSDLFSPTFVELYEAALPPSDDAVSAPPEQ